MKAKLLRGLSALVKTLGIVAGFNVIPFIEPHYGVLIFAAASATKDWLQSVGDLLDDGKINKSFACLAFALILALGSVGCANPERLVRALAKDPAAVSVKVQVGTPWGVQTAELQRVGATSNNVSVKDGAITTGKP